MKFAYLIEPPFNYRSESGAITGCDVELARVILTMIGISDVDFVETEFSQLLPGLEDRRWDMTTGLFDTAERRKIASFSCPIWTLPDGLLVRKGNPRHLIGYASAAKDPGCTMVAVRNQLQHRAITDSGVPDAQVLVCETYEEAAQAVLDGHADAYASVAMAHAGFLRQRPDLELEFVAISPGERAAAAGAFAYRRSDVDFGKAIDAALSAYLGSDEHKALMRRFGLDDSSPAVAGNQSAK
ncbi:transporter substrate-binding domain-containing protein [Agrobacterium sp. NPDC089420]|uniref:transporter substrate-binding domain-containing protein n=1 Tax=Agrobacterium sp. NPDC089420 TaxID=3363918 RepID=UPI003850526A